jgi:hypothetical protein
MLNDRFIRYQIIFNDYPFSTSLLLWKIQVVKVTKELRKPISQPKKTGSNLKDIKNFPKHEH